MRRHAEGRFVLAHPRDEALSEGRGATGSIVDANVRKIEEVLNRSLSSNINPRSYSRRSENKVYESIFPFPLLFVLSS